MICAIVSGGEAENSVRSNCPHDCPCGAPQLRFQGQHQPTRSIVEVKESEEFRRKTEDVREGDFRLANHRLQPLGHLPHRIEIAKDFAGFAWLDRSPGPYCALTGPKPPAGLRRSQHYSDRRRCASCVHSIHRHTLDQLARLCYGDRQQPRAGFGEGRFESKLQAGFFA